MKTSLALLVSLAIATTASAQPRPNPCGGAAMRRPPPPVRRAEPDPKKTYAIKLGATDGIDGDESALVTIVDNSDYACPYCDKVRPTLAALKAKYGKDLRIVYKQFVVHVANAMADSLGACVAQKQHKFAEMDAALWANYKSQSHDKDVEGRHCWETKEGCPNVLAAANVAKLDVANLPAEMIKCEADLKQSMAEMQTFGVDAIPMFFINGRPLVGSQPQASFEAIIDEELLKATSRVKAGEKPNRYYQHWVVEKGDKALLPRRANPCGGM